MDANPTSVRESKGNGIKFDARKFDMRGVFLELEHINKLEIDSLSEEFSRLSRLEELSLSSCPIQSLPESIGKLTGLTKLRLWSCPIQSLPESIGKLTGLTSLRITFCKLTTIPDQVCDLAKLEKLDLSQNELISLPRNLGSLTCLTDLDLSDNQINSLPETIGRLIKLKQLNLRINSLKSLPESFVELRVLRLLWLSYNEFTSLPSLVAGLPKLRYLSAHDNPLANPQLKILAERNDSFLEFFKQLQASEPIPQRSLNVIVLGHGQAGKTTILRSIQRAVNANMVVNDSKSDPIVETERTMAHSFVRLESNGLVWRFTDLPGQAEYFATYSHFLSIPSAIILIVCSLKRALIKNSKGFVSIDWLVLEEDCRLWCSMVNHLVKSGKRIARSRSYLILTHYDLLEENQIEWNNSEKPSWENSDVRRVESRRAEFDSKWQQLCLDLRVYDATSLSREAGICLNGKRPAEVKSKLWDFVLIPAAKSLLNGQTTPAYFAALNSTFLEFQDKIFPLRTSASLEAGLRPLSASSINHRSHLPYLTSSAAVKLFRLPPFSLDSEEKCREMISILVSFGEIIDLGQKILVLSPTWLSHVISAVVMPAAEPFNGVKTDNGAILYPQLRDFLMHTYRLRHGFRLFQSEVQLKEILELLSELDILIQPADIQQHLAQVPGLADSIPPYSSVSSSSLTSQNLPRLERNLYSQPIFIPSRMELPSLNVVIPCDSYVYGRRLQFRNDPNCRFPPATIPLMVCWLGGFSETRNWRDDCARDAVRLRLSDDCDALICLDHYHRWLDIIIWARSAGLCTVAKSGPKLVAAVKWIIAFLGYQNQAERRVPERAMVAADHRSLRGLDSAVSLIDEEKMKEWTQSDLGEREDYLDEEKLCGACVMEAWQAGGRGSAAEICVIPPPIGPGLHNYEDRRRHTDTWASLEFPADPIQPQDSESKQSSIDPSWNSLQLKKWIVQREPLLAHWFQTHGHRTVLDIKTILKLKKLSWNELDDRLRDSYGCSSRSLRLKLIECFRQVQMNVAAPSPSAGHDHDPDHDGGRRGPGPGPVPVHGRGISQRYRDRSPTRVGSRQAPRFTVDSCVARLPLSLRQQITGGLIAVPANTINWKTLAAEFDLFVYSDLMAMEGTGTGNGNGAEVLLNQLGDRGITVKTLIDKLRHIQKIDLAMAIEEKLKAATA